MSLSQKNKKELGNLFKEKYYKTAELTYIETDITGWHTAVELKMREININLNNRNYI